MLSRSYRQNTTSQSVARPLRGLQQRFGRVNRDDGRPQRYSNGASKAWAVTIQLHSPNSRDNILTDLEAAYINSQLTSTECGQLFHDVEILTVFDRFFSTVMSSQNVIENTAVADVIDGLNTPPRRIERSVPGAPVQRPRDPVARQLIPLDSPPFLDFEDDLDDFMYEEAQRWESSDEEMREVQPGDVRFDILESNDRWRVLNGAQSPAALCGRIEKGTAGNLHIQAILLATGPPSRNGNGVSRITAKVLVHNIFKALEGRFQRCPTKRFTGTVEPIRRRMGKTEVECAVDMLKYCTTQSDKDGQWCIGHFQYGVIPPVFQENVIRRENPEEVVATRSNVAATLFQRVRSGEWQCTDDMMAALTETELAKVGRFLKSGGLFDRLFEVERRKQLLAIAGKERMIVWIHGPAGIGKDRLAIWSIARQWLRQNWSGYTDETWLSQIAFKTNDKWWASGDPDKLVTVWSDARLEFTDGNGNVQKGIPYVEILTLFDRISVRPVEVKGRMASLNTRLIIVTSPEPVEDFVRPLDGVTHDRANAKEQLLRRVNLEMTIENSRDTDGNMKPMDDWKLVMTRHVAPKARDETDRSSTCLQFEDEGSKNAMNAVLSYN